MYEVWRLICEGTHLIIYRKWSHQKKKKKVFFVIECVLDSTNSFSKEIALSYN